MNLSFIKISGKIIDASNKNPISGVKINQNQTKTTTDDNGNFILEIKLPIIVSNPSQTFKATITQFSDIQNSDKYIKLSPLDKQYVKDPLFLNFFQKNYSPSKKIFPFTGEGLWLEDLGVIELSSLNKQLDYDKLAVFLPSDEEKKILIFQNKTQDLLIGPEALLNSGITQLNQTVKTTLIPLVVSLITQFGVDLATLQFNDFTNKKTCPDNKLLLDIIKRRNKIVTQLNNLYKAVNTISKSLTLLSGFLEVLKIAIQIAKAVPSPAPASITAVLIETENKLDKITKIISGSAYISLVITATLKRIIDLLGILDSLIQQCSQDQNVDLVAINSEIIKAGELSNTSNITSENYKGFNLSIQEEKTSGPYKKRYAIARDVEGVQVLRGESSFSSSTEILLNELKFIIDRDHLKAF